MEEHVVRHYRGPDQGQAGHQSALGNVGDTASQQFSQVRLHHEHGDQEYHSHDDDAGSQQFFQVFQGISGEAQEQQDAKTPNRSNDPGGNPGQGADSNGRPCQVPAHVSEPANSDGHGHQTAQQIPQYRTVFKILDQVLSQPHLGHNTQAGCHALHDNYCNN